MTHQLNAALILLIVDAGAPDDNLPNLLTHAGYRCHCVATVPEAMAFIKTQGGVDLLLATPTCSGADLHKLRHLVEDYLPVIVISDAIDDALLDAYQDANVDGYIERPVNLRLLESKIRSASRMRQLYRREIDQRKQLLSYWQKVDLERELAAKIYDTVLQGNLLRTEAVKAAMSPMALFNGDLLLVEKTPDDHLYLVLGGFSGHGLSASVGAAPVADIFYGMARKGFALADIVQEINLKLYNLLPANMFLAATAVGLYPESKTLSLITCGLPEHYLVNVSDGGFQTIAAKNIPLGIVESIELEIQHFSVEPQHHVFLMTDGVFAAENSRGDAFGVERVLDAVCRNRAGFEALQASLAEHIQGSNQKDDMSLVELICDVENIPWQTSRKVQSPRWIEALTWKSMMEFDMDALRVVNPLPVMVNALMEIQGLQSYRQAIFLIVNELFANALEHGVLQLDSAIKSTPDGFMQFYQLKEERLQGMKYGSIRITFSHQPTVKGGRLTIKVLDSGDGFDWRLRRQKLENNDGYCGRGIRLLETLCSDLIYHGKGNRVTAVFDWHGAP